jgi:hypothetical protein
VHFSFVSGGGGGGVPEGVPPAFAHLFGAHGPFGGGGGGGGRGLFPFPLEMLMGMGGMGGMGMDGMGGGDLPPGLLHQLFMQHTGRTQPTPASVLASIPMVNARKGEQAEDSSANAECPVCQACCSVFLECAPYVSLPPAVRNAVRYAPAGSHDAPPRLRLTAGGVCRRRVGGAAAAVWSSVRRARVLRVVRDVPRGASTLPRAVSLRVSCRYHKTACLEPWLKGACAATLRSRGCAADHVAAFAGVQITTRALCVARKCLTLRRCLWMRLVVVHQPLRVVMVDVTVVVVAAAAVAAVAVVVAAVEAVVQACPPA